MEMISVRVRQRCWPRRIAASAVATVLVLIGALTSADRAHAVEGHIKDRYGHTVRVSATVVAKLSAKHNLSLVALAAWLPRSKLRKGEGTRREFRITLVKVRCETFPLVGRTCWQTNDKVVLLSVVDYRTNSQGLQQGLITAYCDGMSRCPSWVNRPRVFSGGGSGGGGGGGW